LRGRSSDFSGTGKVTTRGQDHEGNGEEAINHVKAFGGRKENTKEQ